MKPSSLLAIVAAILASPAVLLALEPAPEPSAPVAADAPAETPAPNAAVVAALAERVAKLRKDFEVRQREVITNAIARLSTAAISDASAQALFFECQSILFQQRAAAEDALTVKQIGAPADKTNQRQQQARTVINEADDPGAAAVLRLQAEYLMMTLEAPQSKDRGALVGRVRDFVNKAMNLVRLSITTPVQTSRRVVATVGSRSRDKEQEKLREQQEQVRARRRVTQQLSKSVMSTVFAEAFHLSTYHQKMQDWVDAPLSLDAVYTTVILPHYRKVRREDLVTVWDEYLTHSLSLQRALLDDSAFAQWSLSQYKDLQWEKWSDLLQYGMNPQVAADQLAMLINDNPVHESLPQWLDELKELTEAAQPEPTEPPPAPAPVPALGSPEAPFKF